jgi:protein O-mannosyl-transferase
MGRKSKLKRERRQTMTDVRSHDRQMPLDGPDSYPVWERWLLFGWRPYALLLLLCGILYGMTVGYDFSPFDDYTIIVEHMDRFSTLSKLPSYFTSLVFEEAIGPPYYRPFLLVSFMIDMMIGKGSPAMFHLTNILFHCGVVCLLFYVFRLVALNRRVAFLLAALFAVHPMHVGAVVWIPGRNDSMLAILILLSFISALYYIRSSRIRFLLLHILSFMGVLFTKENGVFIAPLIVLYCMLFESGRTKWYLLLIWMCGCWGICIGGLIALRHMVLVHSSFDIMQALQIYPFEMINILIVYCGKFILPIHQKIYTMLAELHTHMYMIIVALSAIIISILKVKNMRMVLWGLSWFIFFLWLPCLVHLWYGTGYIEGHRLYVPAIGLLLVISQVHAAPVRRYVQPAVLYTFVVMIIGTCGVLVWRNAAPYASRGLCLETALRQSPNNGYVAYQKGYLLRKEKKYAEAVDAITYGISLNSSFPQSSEFYNIRGSSLMHLNKLDDAEADFSTAIKLNPDDPIYYWNRALTFIHQKRYAEALADVNNAIARKTDVEFLVYRAALLYELSQDKEARAALTEAYAYDQVLAEKYARRFPGLLELLSFDAPV